MRRCLYILAGLLLVVGAGCSKPKSKAEQLCKHAMELKEAQRFDDALRLLRTAVDEDPAYDQAYYGMGEIYELDLDNYEQAIVWYEKYLGVSKNEKMKERVASTITELRSAVKQTAAAPAGAAPLSPTAKDAVDKALAAERAKLEREFNARLTAVTAQKDRALEKAQEENTKLKSGGGDLQGKLEELQRERDDAVAKANKLRGHEEIAELINSPTFKGSDKERQLANRLVEMQTEKDKLAASVGQNQGKQQQLEAQIIQLRQTIAENAKGGTADADLQKRLQDTLDDNKRLTEQVALLKSAESSTARTSTGNDGKLAALQSQLDDAEKTRDRALADKQRADAALADLKQRTDQIAAAGTATGDGSTDNRKLRLQIEKITSEYNQLSAKNTASEQRVKQLQDDLDTIQKLQPNSKAVVDSGFSDLSDEIVKMQKMIDTQKKLIAKRDTDIRSLTESNIQLQQQADGKAAPDSSRKLIDELNRELKNRDDRITEMNGNLERAMADSSSNAVATARIQELETDLQKAKAEAGARAAVNTLASVPSPSYSTKATTTVPRTTTPAAKSTIPTTTYRPTTAGRTAAPASTGSAKLYTVRAGDTLGAIAVKYYGDANKWRVIYNYNKDKLKNGVRDLREGMSLYIP